MQRKLFFFAFVLSCLFAASLISAAEQYLERARLFAMEEEYTASYLEARRYMFLMQQASLTPDPEVFLVLSQTSFFLEQYSRAHAFYERYRNLVIVQDPLVFTYEMKLLEKVQNRDFVRLRLFTLAFRSDIDQEIRDLILIGNLRFAAMYHDWENFRMFLDMANNSGSVSPVQLSELHDLLEEAENHQGKSPGLARGLSIVLPGAGQLYAGYPLDALNAFIINGFFIGATVYSVSIRELGDVLNFWGPNFIRFYDGNLRNAYLAAEASNREFMVSLADRMLYVLASDSH